jgi:hypothetical protein
MRFGTGRNAVDDARDDRTSLIRVLDFATRSDRAARGRRWRTYGDDPLPTSEKALDEPFTAFPSWFLRIECERCGKVQMGTQVHMRQDDMLIRTVLDRMRHDGCGGRAGKVELLTGIEGTSPRPVRRIVLRTG